MSRLYIVSIVVGTIVFSNAIAQRQLSTRRWQTIDLKFEAAKVPANPFEVEFGCVLTNEVGTKLNIPGFYNGDSEWVVRFTPSTTGTWSAKSFSSIKKLSGRKITIEVSHSEQGEFGAIKINPEHKHHFIYENGLPYNLLAFEADWLFALDYGNDQLPKSKTLIKTIQQNGFNQVIMNVYAYDVKWPKDTNLKKEYDYGSKLDIFPFGGNNQDPDFTTLNVDFFKHLDRVVELLDENNIVAHLMIYVWNKQVNWPEPCSDADNRYFDYVVKRYQGYNNIVWDISKEALGYGHDDINYITDRIDRIRSLDAYNRLLTVHDYRYCKTYPDKIDFISIQSWSTNIYNNMLDIRNRFEDKPILNIEHGGYEKSPYKVFQGNFDNPEVCLRRNYYCAFAGVYTTYYWQATSWNVIIYDPFSHDINPQPHFAYYKHFQDFFQKYKFKNLKPSHRYNASGLGLTNENGRYIVYVPNENVAIDVNNLPKTKSLNVVWFNTITGEYSPPKKISWLKFLRLQPFYKGVDNILILDAK